MGPKEILYEIGESAVLEQTAEECAELAHACLKMARKNRGDNPTPAEEIRISDCIHEELADLLNCADLLLSIPWVDPARVENVKREKMQRWEERIENGR